MSKKIVICNCLGGFGVSTAGTIKLRGLENPWALRAVLEGEYYPPSTRYGKEGESIRHINDYEFNSYCDEIPRDDQDLVSLIQLAGSDFMSGAHAQLKIVEIPSDVAWHIHEYDGIEHIAENHRVWS